MDQLIEIFYSNPNIYGFSNNNADSTLYSIIYNDGTISVQDDEETAFDVYLLGGCSGLIVSFTR